MHAQKFIIDAFNLFYRWNNTSSIFRSSTDIAKALNHSIRTLSSFLEQNKSKCLLVIDGGKTQSMCISCGIRVQYSGPGVTADERILSIVKNSQKPSTLTVVTTDHELGGNARFLGAKNISVENFINLFSQKKSNSNHESLQPLRKFLKPSEKEVQEWMEIFGDISDLDEDM
ncbi:MAG: NYN domain-containing protein [Planctomycetota bacterium]|jgi:predicted RNA-binding protein with PIN domain